MSFFLIPAGETPMLGSTSPLIKKRERAAFVDAAELLAHTRRIAASTNSIAEDARAQAIGEGRAEGAAAAQADLDTALHGFADAVRRIEEWHSAQVAEAAYAATTAIIGSFDDETLVTRLVTQVLARQKVQNGLSIQVAPDLEPRLAGIFGEDGGLPVVANPDLGPNECHVMTANGRIIASLPVQLAVLRERWGIDTQ